MNANIEARKAGDQGRRFATFDGIKKLSIELKESIEDF